METRRAFIRKKSYRIIKKLQDNGFEFSMHRNGNEHCTMALKNGINDHYSPCTVKDAKYYGAIDFGKDDKAFFDYLLTNNKMKTPEQKAEEYLKFIYDECFDDPCYAPDVAQSKKDFLAGYKAANEWISVEDYFPENETYINLKLKNGDLTSIFYETRSDLIMLKRDCTHWKPIN